MTRVYFLFAYLYASAPRPTTAPDVRRRRADAAHDLRLFDEAACVGWGSPPPGMSWRLAFGLAVLQTMAFAAFLRWLGLLR